MGVILQVALPSRVLAAARLQCGAAGAGASRGLGVCAEHARLAARGESARAMEIGDFLGRLGPGGNSQCVSCRDHEHDLLSCFYLSKATAASADSFSCNALQTGYPGTPCTDCQASRALFAETVSGRPAGDCNRQPVARSGERC